MGKKSNSKKRSKSQASPESVYPTPGKRQAVNNMNNSNASTPGMMNMSSPHGHYVQQMPPPQYQQPMYPSSGTYNTCMNPGSPSTYAQTVNPDILNEILKRLNNMDEKLCQLNTIQSSVHKITERLNTMDFRIKEIEKSQHFLSEQYDKLSTNILDNSNCSKAMKTDMKVLSDANYNMRQKQESLMNDITDLKCRSMRDNLLFFGIEEYKKHPSGIAASFDDNQSNRRLRSKGKNYISISSEDYRHIRDEH